MTSTPLMPTMSPSVTTVACPDGTILSLPRYGRSDADVGVILCHGFIQNSAAFAVPSRSLVEFLVEAGFAVYPIDLRGRANARVTHDLLQTIDHDARAIVTAVRARHRRVAWVGHSMGGLIGAALTDGGADALVVIGSPLMPGRSVLHQASSLRTVIAYGRARGARGQPFPGKQYAQGFVRGRRVLDGRAGAFTPLPLWRPGSYARDEDLRFTLENAFANDSHNVMADLVELVVTRGERGGRVMLNGRLAVQSAPTLAIVGTDDALAPPDTARALLDRIAARHRALREVRAGHIDLLTGDAAPVAVWRPLSAFIDEHLRKAP